METPTNGSKNCPLLQYDNCPMDKPTSFASLGTRFLFSLLAWSVLGLNITPGSSFFVSLMLFSGPLLLEYKKFIPDTNLRQWLRNVGMFVAGLCVVISSIGLTGILLIIQVNDNFFVQVSKTFIVFKGSYFPLNIIWCIVGLSVILTGIDWVVYEGLLEKRYIQEKHESKA